MVNAPLLGLGDRVPSREMTGDFFQRVNQLIWVRRRRLVRKVDPEIPRLRIVFKRVVLRVLKFQPKRRYVD